MSKRPTLLLFLCLISGFAISQTKDQLTGEEKKYLLSFVYPISSVDPEQQGNDDLKVLDGLVGNSKVVALGEVTHGSREIYRLKDRMYRYLAQNKGYDIFSLEAAMPEAYNVNQYVVNGEGDPATLLKGMYFWTWQTEEMLSIINWMKQYNSQNQNKVRFSGFDMQFYQGALAHLKKDFLKYQFPESEANELSVLLTEIHTKTIQKKSGHTLVSKKQKENIDVLLNNAKKLAEKIPAGTDRKWFLQNVRIIEQYLAKSYSTRDKLMAENVMWIAENDPNSKIVVSAHNGHINNRKNEMGSFLKEGLKNDYTTFGFAFYEGTYTALSNTLKKESLRTPQIAQTAIPGTVEYLLNSLDIPILILDLKRLRSEADPLAKWIVNDIVKFRITGAVALKREFWDANVTKDFDYLVFIKKSTNSRLLD
ncbi:erythromycin esterase family protein [Chryseobacterium gregarium]|uniref:erythromycin esterase family protein n=1 Tax=Chryseobacterium gregarium TaxID=456299 RepID=UPI0003F5AFD3|nr:erythromycin esterase family protein [Chryseobacterium gregarium]